MKKPNLTLVQHSDRRQADGPMETVLRSRPAPEARSEKIASLSKAIRNNAYRLDCRKLADCLIASLLLGLLK
jgi:anti-sigma28 factor (negative regulator of flagellin synthesis)